MRQEDKNKIINVCVILGLVLFVCLAYFGLDKLGNYPSIFMGLFSTIYVFYIIPSIVKGLSFLWETDRPTILCFIPIINESFLTDGKPTKKKLYFVSVGLSLSLALLFWNLPVYYIYKHFSMSAGFRILNFVKLSLYTSFIFYNVVKGLIYNDAFSDIIDVELGEVRGAKQTIIIGSYRAVLRVMFYIPIFRAVPVIILYSVVNKIVTFGSSNDEYDDDDEDEYDDEDDENYADDYDDCE